MIDKTIEIKKYPFLGYSQTLMEYFAIIGYQEDYIHEMLIPNCKQGQVNLTKFPPTILSSVTTSVDYGMINNELILSQLYPEMPKILSSCTYPPSPKPKPTNIISSICFDTYDGKGKTFYVCYGYNFYESYKLFFIPKSFCIISQFPFFTTFKKICSIIHMIFEDFYLGKEMRDEVIPIEFILYSIVNFIPSPINYNLHLDLFKNFYHNQNETKSFEIKKLSGYPYIDFNLSEVFNLIPLYQFIQLFILTVLEENMLIISPNLEILNTVMYIFSILNYPCNDSTYFWHILSVSKETLNEKGADNRFVGKIMASLLGINCHYSDELKISNFSSQCYIYDLDNKRLMFQRNSDDEDYIDKNSRVIFEYVDEILKEKKVQSKFLKKFIEILIKDLEAILRKNVNFTLYPKNKTVDFFDMKEDTDQQNRKIQEAFYDFYLNFLMLFYQDNCLSPTFEKIGKDKSQDEDESQKYYFLNYEEHNEHFSEQEKKLCEGFRSTVKYKIYFENFIQDFQSLELFKIPLLFSEEYINIKKRDANAIFRNKLSFFDIIDKFYVDPHFGNDPIIEVTLNNFYSTIMDIVPSLNLRKRKMTFISLDRKVLTKYIYYIHNQLKEELMVIYPSLDICDNNVIALIQKSKIQSLLQTEINENCSTSTETLIIYSLIFIFSMTFQLFSFNSITSSLNFIENHIERLTFFLRDYVFIILMTFYKQLLAYKEKGDLRKVDEVKIFYYVLLNFLRINHLIPNEEMMTLLRKFNNEAEISLQEKSINIDKEDQTFNFNFTDEFMFKMYMTYNFDKNGTKSMEELISNALINQRDETIEITGNNLKPKICISLFGKKIFSELFTPLKLLHVSQKVYEKFINSQSLDIRDQEILPRIKELIINTICYCKHLSSIQDLTFVLSACYFLFFCEGNTPNNDI